MAVMRAIGILLVLGAAAVGRADTLYVGVASGKLAVYDTSNCALLDSKTGLYRPQYLAYDATRDALFIGSADISGTVTMYDRASGTVSPTIVIGALIAGLAVHPSGDELYVLEAQGVHVVELATGRDLGVMSARTGGAPRFLRMAPDGSRLVSIDDRGLMTVYDPAGRSSEASRELVWPDTSGVVMDPLNRDMMTVASQGLLLGLYEWPAAPLRWFLDSGYIYGVNALAAPAGLAVSPDGQERYVSTGDDEIAIFSCQDRKAWCDPLRVTPPRMGVRVGRGPTDMAVTAGGEWLFVGNYRDRTLSKVNIRDRTAQACGDLDDGALDLEMGR
jgi:DNA-binding beta-propeller fold protein YncE